MQCVQLTVAFRPYQLHRMNDWYSLAACITNSARFKDTEEAIEMHSKAGRFLQDVAEFGRAETMYKHELERAEHGGKANIIAKICAGTGSLCHLMGRFSERTGCMLKSGCCTSGNHVMASLKHKKHCSGNRLAAPLSKQLQPAATLAVVASSMVLSAHNWTCTNITGSHACGHVVKRQQIRVCVAWMQA